MGTLIRSVSGKKFRRFSSRARENLLDGLKVVPDVVEIARGRLLAVEEVCEGAGEPDCRGFELDSPSAKTFLVKGVGRLHLASVLDSN